MYGNETIFTLTSFQRNFYQEQCQENMNEVDDNIITGFTNDAGYKSNTQVKNYDVESK